VADGPPTGPHVLLRLQRSAGNRAVARAVGDGSVVVQRASRDELLAALRAAAKAGHWQEVATRLNGFNTPDIRRLAAGLSLGEAANTRAAVATYLAGWPQEQAIIGALDAGRSEVARIGKIYQAYETAVRSGAWPDAVRQLHAMSDADIDARLRRLPPDSLQALCGAAPELSERITHRAGDLAKAQGIELPQGIGHLVVGGQDLGAVREIRSGGEAIVKVPIPPPEEVGASVGTRQITTGPVMLGLVAPGAPATDAAVKALLAKYAAPAGATTAEGAVAGGTVVAGETTAAGGGMAAGAGAGAAMSVGVVALVVLVVGGTAYAVVHYLEIKEKLERLGEFGGTLPPGGAPDPDEDRDEDQCVPITVYGPLDDLGRATGVDATLTGPPLGGQSPRVDPAGFVSGVSGREGGQGRAHLLAETLGGNGSANNLVPFDQRANEAMYRDIESKVLSHLLRHPTHCISYTATPMYDGRSLSPSLIHVYAIDTTSKEVIVNRSAYNRTLH